MPGKRRYPYHLVKIFAFSALLIMAWKSAAIAQSYKIAAKDLEATVDLATMSVDVKHLASGVIWRMSRKGAREFVYEKDGEISQVSLADSRDKKVTRLGKGAVLVTLADFRFEILILIDEETGELAFKLIPLEEDHNLGSRA